MPSKYECAQADIPTDASTCSAGNRVLHSDTSLESSPPPALLFLSMCLLFLACADDGLVGQLAKLSWLASVLLLAFTDTGGAFGVYIASVAIFSPRSSMYLVKELTQVGGWGSPLERPDNYALVFVVLGLAFIGAKRTQTPAAKLFTFIAGIFLAYGVVQMVLLGVATRSTVAWFFRAYGGFCLSVLLWRAAPGMRDLRRFAAVVTILGGYMATLTLLEAAKCYSWVIPRWIVDPALNGNIIEMIGAGRAGGLFMESEYNGAALGLICCIIAASVKLGDIRTRIAKGIALILCLAAIYFTYTRGAWLAVAAGIAILSVPGVRSERDRRKTALQCIAAIVVAAVLLIIPNHRASERLGNSENVYYRLNVWAASMKMAAERPWFGYGYGQFASQVVEYHDQVGSVPFKHLGLEGTVTHNVLVNVLVEEGSVGFLLYMVLGLIIYRNASKRASRAWGGLGVAWVLAICAVYFINMQFISGYEPTNNLLLFGSLGMTAGLTRCRLQVMPSVEISESVL